MFYKKNFLCFGLFKTNSIFKPSEVLAESFSYKPCSYLCRCSDKKN